MKYTPEFDPAIAEPDLVLADSHSGAVLVSRELRPQSVTEPEKTVLGSVRKFSGLAHWLAVLRGPGNH